MKIDDCHKEEKPISKSIDNSTQSSALSSHCFEKLCADLLNEGKSVRFEAPGKSMYPAILDGETLIVEPVVPSAVQVGDIILYKSEEKLIAHRVISIKKFNARITQLPDRNDLHENTRSSMAGSSVLNTQYSLILRGDASYSYDEPVYADQILGKIIAIERNGRSINPYGAKHKFSCWARIWKSRLKRILF
jgi:hypothetical protein